MNPKFLTAAAVLILPVQPSRAQDAQIVADNLEYSRDFYAGVHVVAIAKEPVSFAYDR